MIINRVRIEEQKAAARNTFIGDISRAVNPAEARKLEKSDRYEMCFGEDRSLLLYGMDIMKIMTALVTYHNALYCGNTREANSAWKETEITAESLDSYFIPIDFEWPGPGLESKDGLTRSQLRGLLRRCRKHRT